MHIHTNKQHPSIRYIHKYTLACIVPYIMCTQIHGVSDRDISIRWKIADEPITDTLAHSTYKYSLQIFSKNVIAISAKEIDQNVFLAQFPFLSDPKQAKSCFFRGGGGGGGGGGLGVVVDNVGLGNKC